MPTAAKLVAAFLLAIVMYVATVNYLPRLPQGTQIGYITAISAAIGSICGWLFVGNSLGNHLGEAVSNGLKGAVIALVWVLMFASVYQMIRLSMRDMYDGVFDAVLGVFARFLELSGLIFAPGVLGVIFVGGGIVGVAARSASKRWK
jgi:hypothetical protein